MIKHYLFTSNVKYFFILSRTSFNSYLCNTPTHSPVVIVRGGECEDRYKVIALFIFFILSRTSFNSYLCNTPTHSPVVIVRGGECEDRYKVIALFTGIIFIKPVWLVVCFCFCSDVDVTTLSSPNKSLKA
jgi:hypothetical protein